MVKPKKTKNNTLVHLTCGHIRVLRADLWTSLMKGDPIACLTCDEIVKVTRVQ